MWISDGWTARVVKNEDDDGWGVAMTADGASEPALVGPWTMGRDKKNPKPLDQSAFLTLVKTAREFVRRSEQQLHASLHQSLEVAAGAGRVRVYLDIEPDEENPMLGFRGASRYISGEFTDAFGMECEALKRVRNDMGLTNVEIMVPFVRTVRQASRVGELLADRGLKRGQDGLRLIMMCEVPSNAILAEQFLEHFDGMSIGSNDLTQLTLGLDRDSGLEQLADDFDERDPAVKAMISRAIAACRGTGKYVGICGQGPSDHPDFADWLAQEGIVSISLNPDSVIETWKRLASQK